MSYIITNIRHACNIFGVSRQFYYKIKHRYEKYGIRGKTCISYYPGYLLGQDTFEVGYIKGVGKIYMQAVVDTYGSFGFAKLYTSKISTIAADILVDRVLPFYRAMGIKIRNILTDNGKEYCGDEIEHDYEFLLKIFGIRYRRTRIGAPQSNGFVERFSRRV